MSEKLLPCPFCGCTKIPVQRGNGIGDVWLECTECEASTRLRENIQTCVKDWNRRAASPADQVNDARYRKYAARLVDFIQGVQWDDELPRDVDTIVQFWPNAAAIDAAMSASKEGR